MNVVINGIGHDLDTTSRCRHSGLRSSARSRQRAATARTAEAMASAK